MSETKLLKDDIIEVHGWVMLDKIESGRYKIAGITEVHRQKLYSFCKPRGKKVIIRHYVSNVDPWVRDSDDPDLNKIVIAERLST